jgi:hypothetical protein
MRITREITKKSPEKSFRTYRKYATTYMFGLLETGCVVDEVNVRFEAFTAVTMKNVVFWDIKTQFVLHRGHITTPLQSTAS